MLAFLRRALRAAACCLLPLLVGCKAPPAPPVQPVPGSLVRMAPPAGFLPAPNFAGFVTADGQASILVAELPAHSAPAVATLFNDLPSARHHFATQGVEIDRLQSIAADGITVPVAIGRQAAHGHVFDKWVALYQGRRTVLVTVQAPTAHALAQPAALAALASVTLGSPASLDEALAALPFHATARPPFRVIDTLAGAGMLMMAGERDVDPDGGQPRVIIASQLSLPAGSDDLGRLSGVLIGGTREIQQGTPLARQAVAFGGIDGERVTGSLPDGGRYVHYLALWPGRRYVRLVAIFPPGSDADAYEAVEAIARSVRFKD